MKGKNIYKHKKRNISFGIKNTQKTNAKFHVQTIKSQSASLRTCCCFHINSHNQVRGHRAGSSHSGVEQYPRDKNTNQTWYTHISQLTQFMSPPETYKSEIGSQPTMCQVHTGAYVSLLAPGKTDCTPCHPKKTTTCILHVAPITTHTHDRRESIGKKKQRKEEKIKERRENTRKRKNKEKGKQKKQEKQEKARQEEEAKKGKEKKMLF